MVDFDPSRRCTMHECITSNLFLLLRDRGRQNMTSSSPLSHRLGAWASFNECNNAPNSSNHHLHYDNPHTTNYIVPSSTDIANQDQKYVKNSNNITNSNITYNHNSITSGSSGMKTTMHGDAILQEIAFPFYHRATEVGGVHALPFV